MTNGGDTMAEGPIRLDETTRAAVASGRLVHLATINSDGTPQVTCIYVGWDGDEIVAGHLADHVKLRNIRRDPRVTLSVESDVPSEGFSPYIVIKGIARVEEGGAVPLLRRITAGQFPPPGDNWPGGFVTRISPRKLSGTGPWRLVNGE
jgi:PPOX class probable F420-dependent enzyme